MLAGVDLEGAWKGLVRAWLLALPHEGLLQEFEVWIVDAHAGDEEAASAAAALPWSLRVFLLDALLAGSWPSVLAGGCCVWLTCVLVCSCSATVC